MQWQIPVLRGKPVTVNLTLPHKHPPVLDIDNDFGMVLVTLKVASAYEQTAPGKTSGQQRQIQTPHYRFLSGLISIQTGA